MTVSRDTDEKRILMTYKNGIKSVLRVHSERIGRFGGVFVFVLNVTAVK